MYFLNEEREEVIMSKYEVVNIGGSDCGEYMEELKFDSVNELSEEDVCNVLGGLCLLVNCSEMKDEWVKESWSKLWEKVSDVLEEMVNDGMWYEGEGREEFERKYGEMNGLRWGIEYDDNCSVLLKGDWWELRKEVKEYFEVLEY